MHGAYREMAERTAALRASLATVQRTRRGT
jgi:hypothetical protein